MDNFDLKTVHKKIVKLIDIVIAENNLLANFKIQEIHLNHEIRNNIITYLNDASKHIAKHSEEYKKLSDPVVEDIKTDMLKLNELLLANNLLISKALEVNKKIVEIVANQLLQNHISNSHYNKQGKNCLSNKEIKPITLTSLA